MLSVDDVNGILRLPLLGVIAEEPEIIITTNRGEPLALRADYPTGAAYRTIAARVAGEDVAAPMPAAPRTLAARTFQRHSSEGSSRDRLFPEALRANRARVRRQKSVCAWF